MRFVPGSHRQTIVEHRDTNELANMLSRGQELVIELVDRPRALLDPRDIEIASRAMKLQDGIRIAGVSRSE
jgi:hypothetical protein